VILGKYNQSKTITFDLYDLDGVDMSVAATFAAGDVKIMKDEGAEANTTNLPTDEGSSYSLVLTATEMSAARIRIILIDQTATKVWLDTSIGIETYGNASAEHAFDLDTASTAQTGDSYARIGAPAGASIAADLVVIDNFVDDLETRLTATRAGYLDNLSVAPATATALSTAQTDLDTITGTNGVLIDDTEAAALVDDVWDEVLTGGAHNVTNSAGRRLRSIQEFQGYEGGHVWIDGVNGTAGTVSYENGTVENPVDAPAGSIADANTIAAAVSLSRFSVAPATSITFAASQANQIFEGHEWTVALGGQAVTASMFIDASVSGTGTGAESEWEQCIFGVTSLPAMQAYNCSFTATASGGFTMSAAGDYRFINCQSGVAGSGSPLFTSGAGAHTAEFRRWSGGITFAGLTSSDTITVGGEMGTIDLGSPASAAVIEVRGTYKAITNIGSATVNTDGAILASDVADTLADTNELQTNQGNWLTATGFATEAKQDIIDANVDAILVDTNELQTDWVDGGRLDNLLDGASSAGDPWTTAIPGAYGVGTAGYIVGNNVDAPISTVDTVVDGIQTDLDNATDGLGAIKTAVDSRMAEASINTTGGAVDNVTLVGTTTTNTDMRGTDSAATATALATVDTNVDAILVDTGTTLPATLAALNDISVSDILTTQMTEAYAADGVAPTLAQALFLIQQTIGDFSITSTTLTTKQLDGTTTAATYTLDDATNPTSRTRFS